MRKRERGDRERESESKRVIEKDIYRERGDRERESESKRVIEKDIYRER